MSGIAAALVLIGMTVLVGFAVWALLEGRRITHPIYKRGDYGLTDDDAPRDDNDWPPEHRVIRDDQGRIITRLNGDH